MRLRLLTAIALAALATVSCGSSEGNGAPETTPPPPPTTAPPATFGPDEALAVAHAYAEAYNAGDTEGVLALFVADATFSDNFGAQSRSDWEHLLAWNAGQGTVLDAFDCTVTDEDGNAITVSCSLENRDALTQAVGAPAVPVTQILTITPDGIVDWEFTFGQPDFNTVWDPFRDWMSSNHAENVDSVGFGNWSSVEEAEQNGRLTAQYADVWKSYLEANGCTYSDGC